MNKREEPTDSAISNERRRRTALGYRSQSPFVSSVHVLGSQGCPSRANANGLKELKASSTLLLQGSGEEERKERESRRPPPSFLELKSST